MLNNLNLYNLVSDAVSLLTPKREIYINKTEFVETEEGDLIPRTQTERVVHGIVQPLSPTNLTQFNEHSLDSALQFKVYFQSEEPLLLTSSEPKKNAYMVCFHDPIGSDNLYSHNIFAVNNYTMNGWIRMHVVRINLETLYDLVKA